VSLKSVKHHRQRSWTPTSHEYGTEAGNADGQRIMNAGWLTSAVSGVLSRRLFRIKYTQRYGDGAVRLARFFLYGSGYLVPGPKSSVQVHAVGAQTDGLEDVRPGSNMSV